MILGQLHCANNCDDNVMMMTYQRFFLLALILGTFAWRVTGLTYQSLWRDEVDAIYFALRNLPDTLSMFVDMAQNGALYFLSLRGWFYLVGASEFALRYVSVMASIVSIPLTWQVARRLVGVAHPVAGRVSTSPLIVPLVAVLFLVFNPYQLWYAQEGKMYTLVIALTLLAHWCWLTGIRQGGKRVWLVYLITVSVCLYIHLLTIIIIPLHLLWFVIAWPQSRWHWRGYLFALAGLTLPYLPFVWWQWAMLTSTEKLSGFNFTPLCEMLYTLLINHSYGLLPAPPLFRLLPIFFLGAVGLLFGAGVIAAIRAQVQSTAPDVAEPPVFPAATPDLNPWRRYFLLVSWLFIPIVTIYVLSLRQPVYTDRYIIWIAPAAMILLALGVQALYQQSGRLALPLVTILVVYTLGLWGQMGWQQKNETIKYDLRSAIHYVVERRQPETLLILQIPHIEFSYRYYSGNVSGAAAANVYATSDGRIGNWKGGLWTNNGLADEQAIVMAEQEMAQITQGAPDVWVLTSEVEMWDARHLMSAWLDSHGRMVESAEFHGVHARHYVLDGGSQP